MGRFGRKLLIPCFAFVSLAEWLFGADRTNRLDRVWKRYRNEQFGYCVDYPARWLKSEAFDGAGMWVGAGAKKHSLPLGEMDVRALRDGVSEHLQTASVSLTESATIYFHDRKQFQRAQDIQVIDQHAMRLLDAPALFIKDQYRDPLDRHMWIDEVIFAARQQILYRIELECRADQIGRFEPIFQRFAASFQFQCEPGR